MNRPLGLSTFRPGRCRLAAGTAHGGRDRGSAVLEAAIGVPAFGLFVALILLGGRTALAHQAVESAANEAARTASVARTQDQAEHDATAAATNTLTSQDLRCVRSEVTVDTTGFAAPVGTSATVTATVRCVVNLSDLSLPGVPGRRTVQATMSSPLDTYRER
jgi:Flp pilus assembly protein TadG